MPTTIKTECGLCEGTGIKHHPAEREGFGSICGACEGSGCLRVEFHPFVGRKIRTDVRLVMPCISNIGRPSIPGDPVTYKEFLDGRRPESKLIESNQYGNAPR